MGTETGYREKTWDWGAKEEKVWTLAVRPRSVDVIPSFHGLFKRRAGLNEKKERQEGGGKEADGVARGRAGPKRARTATN